MTGYILERYYTLRSTGVRWFKDLLIVDICYDHWDISEPHDRTDT